MKMYSIQIKSMPQKPVIGFEKSAMAIFQEEVPRA